MNAPQVIAIVVISINLFCVALLHGRKKPENTFNFWGELIQAALIVLVLKWGGFFP